MLFIVKWRYFDVVDDIDILDDDIDITDDDIDIIDDDIHITIRSCR